MPNFFTNLVKPKKHSLEDVRISLEDETIEENDFLSVLEKHHGFLEESISVLMDIEAEDFEKQEHLNRFFRLFEMHAKAEQETLYIHLRQNIEKEARIEGFGGQDEHDMAFQLEDELLEMGYPSRWTEAIAAKARVAATLVKNHLKEEEHIMFPIAKNDLDDVEFETMRVEYIAKCKFYLDDSKTLGRQSRAVRLDLKSPPPLSQ